MVAGIINFAHLFLQKHHIGKPTPNKLAPINSRGHPPKATCLSLVMKITCDQPSFKSWHWAQEYLMKPYWPRELFRNTTWKQAHPKLRFLSKPKRIWAILWTHTTKLSATWIVVPLIESAAELLAAVIRQCGVNWQFQKRTESNSWLGLLFFLILGAWGAAISIYAYLYAKICLATRKAWCPRLLLLSCPVFNYRVA